MGRDQRFESHLLSQPLAFGYALSLGSPLAGPLPELVKLLTRRLEECPAAIADHPVARAAGIAGIARSSLTMLMRRRFAAASNPRTGTRPQTRPLRIDL